MAKLTITTVTDPMMGMLWETWPTMRKLETHYGDQIDFKFMMGQLVKNVYDLVDPNVTQMYGKKVALNQYWTRLMQVYLQEEQIAGMPIYMGGNERLFDEEHLSSVPLNLGFLAIAGNDSEKENQVLYEMQYDTVVNNLQTNDIKYLTALASKFGIDQSQFESRYNSTGVKGHLAQSQQIMQQMKIDQLPAYILTYNGKSYIIKGIPKYDEWQRLIKQVTDDEIKASRIEANSETINAFINCHPHISSLELKEAFDVEEKDVVELLKETPLEKEKVKSTIFYRKA
ncbi:DsbA family protein [Limosilactobacillus sp. STM2_1]|uniref:DsbA family protein n=1 Tax=Limosilactobacillus rudii TaxID=2759755 RepID=A0A7W3UMV4_9LACO|nr:DsbA family protein [Limosilactobacillus rudii]MBB1080460.1 DsbA family protein [Limosilactobacillus rudii]MBB1098486.1 DsbA family protein [Limosilactobacillus rudii]MCD7135494.1 DsbA family protein [Limosilactobacillus rudii]